MDLVAAEYGWSDKRILGLPLARLRQVVAAIQRRQWLAELAHRRLETAKLRALCTYIAATMQIAEGETNPMLDAAVDLDLGTGTENPASAGGGVVPEQGEPRAAAPSDGPRATIEVGKLADAPAAVRPGQPAPAGGSGLRPIPLENLGSFLTGGRG